MPRWRWRCRWRGRGRPPTPIYISFVPRVEELTPKPMQDSKPLILTYPEIEALRLVDLEGLTYEEAAKHMGVSRGTVWRLVQNARKKLVQVLVEGRPLKIESGGLLEGASQ
ncbi:MAG TPA: DUF134 domain-containing protein [Pyrodictium sp.]|nr:DUF134 domain-containing protein [Pyrodictium sp.]